MNQITCSKCKRIKSENDIAIHYKNGLSGYCKNCKSLSDKQYRIKNKEKLAKRAAEKWRNNKEVRMANRRYKENRRFGLNATSFVDDKYCELCGMTNEQSILKWNRRLTIHHKDNNGRKAIRLKEQTNHDKDNLQIVCMACHCKLTNYQQDYSGRTFRSWNTRRKKYGYSGKRQDI